MVSRVLPRLQTLLPAIVLLIVLSTITPTIVYARNPYTYTDNAEGDPGDGVLDPAIDSGTDGGKDIGTITDLEGRTPLSGWLLPLGDVYLLPIYLPGGLSIPGTLIFEQAWFKISAAPVSLAGRWHNAP